MPQLKSSELNFFGLLLVLILFFQHLLVLLIWLDKIRLNVLGVCETTLSILDGLCSGVVELAFIVDGELLLEIGKELKGEHINIVTEIAEFVQDFLGVTMGTFEDGVLKSSVAMGSLSHELFEDVIELGDALLRAHISSSLLKHGHLILVGHVVEPILVLVDKFSVLFLVILHRLFKKEVDSINSLHLGRTLLITLIDSLVRVLQVEVVDSANVFLRVRVPDLFDLRRDELTGVVHQVDQFLHRVHNH